MNSEHWLFRIEHRRIFSVSWNGNPLAGHLATSKVGRCRTLHTARRTRSANSVGPAFGFRTARERGIDRRGGRGARAGRGRPTRERPTRTAGERGGRQPSQWREREEGKAITQPRQRERRPTFQQSLPATPTRATGPSLIEDMGTNSATFHSGLGYFLVLFRFNIRGRGTCGGNEVQLLVNVMKCK